MRNTRHAGHDGRDYDKKFEFLTPDDRGSSARTASHRYLPAEIKNESSRTMTARGNTDEFSASDFKARWWPAPDAWQ